MAFLPVSDSANTRGFPVVNGALIAVNVFVYFYMINFLDVRTGFEDFITQWGLIPACLGAKAGIAVQPGAGAFMTCPAGDNVILTLVTSVFVHGGLLHLAGNMMFLWVFGDGVEDQLGHLGYLLFYLLCGIAANLTQVAFSVDSVVPIVGASGAIAGVMAAYAVLFPTARLRFLLFFKTVEAPLPAFTLVLIWGAYQVASATGQLGPVDESIAWWAHIGGLVAGFVLVWFLREPGPRYILLPAEPEATPEEAPSHFTHRPRV